MYIKKKTNKGQKETFAKLESLFAASSSSAPFFRRRGSD